MFFLQVAIGTVSEQCSLVVRASFFTGPLDSPDTKSLFVQQNVSWGSLKVNFYRVMKKWIAYNFLRMSKIFPPKQTTSKKILNPKFVLYIIKPYFWPQLWTRTSHLKIISRSKNKMQKKGWDWGWMGKKVIFKKWHWPWKLN